MSRFAMNRLVFQKKSVMNSREMPPTTRNRIAVPTVCSVEAATLTKLKNKTIKKQKQHE